MSGKRLIVVGGGVIGTMHALFGLRAGYEVLQIERDLAPRGASVRNFGLIWVGGRASGTELALALRARVLWEEIAKQYEGVAFRPAGSLTIARTPEEMTVFEAALKMEDADERSFELLEEEQAKVRHPELKGKFIAALRCTADAIVEPRLVLGALRTHLQANDSYTWLPGRHVMDVRSHGVRDHEGTWHDGDLVMCCIGAKPGGFLADALSDAPLRRVRLQMLETRPFAGAISSAIADGDSLRYYPAYRGAETDALPPQDALAKAWSAQLLLVKRLSGHLTIGDTHHYDEPFAFDVNEDPYEHLVGIATDILGPIPSIERRWSGIYSQVTDDSLMYLRKEIEPGVVVVTGPGGRGMTMSPAIAEETFK